MNKVERALKVVKDHEKLHPFASPLARAAFWEGVVTALKLKAIEQLEFVRKMDPS